MPAQHVELQQGIWIDATYLRDAGLGPNLQVVVEPGEIRIVAVLSADEQQAPSQEAWDVFRTLGQDAEPDYCQMLRKSMTDIFINQNDERYYRTLSRHLLLITTLNK